MTPEQRLEDVTFMAANGESLSGAARRLGISVRGLELWLGRHDARHLTNALRINEPRDHNNAANGTKVTHIDAGAARYGRRKASA